MSLFPNRENPLTQNPLTQNPLTLLYSILGIKKRPNVLNSGVFVYTFVSLFCKTLIFNVYCGERGIKTIVQSY